MARTSPRPPLTDPAARYCRGWGLRSRTHQQHAVPVARVVVFGWMIRPLAAREGTRVPQRVASPSGGTPARKAPSFRAVRSGRHLAQRLALHRAQHLARRSLAVGVHALPTRCASGTVGCRPGNAATSVRARGQVATPIPGPSHGPTAVPGADAPSRSRTIPRHPRPARPADRRGDDRSTVPEQERPSRPKGFPHPIR